MLTEYVTRSFDCHYPPMYEYTRERIHCLNPRYYLPITHLKKAFSRDSRNLRSTILDSS